MEFKIQDRKIGGNNPVFIIAELSANHNHDINVALKTIKAMKESGADAVKLQTYTPDTITLNCNNKYFKINQGTIWDGRTLYDLYKEAYMPWEWQPKLKKYAESIGLICFSSPFDKTAVDFLETMNVPAYKIASFEITDIPLIEYAASKGKPMLISTGISELSDIEEALATCKRFNNYSVALLKCTSAYPAPFEEMNLMTLRDLPERFPVIAGLSDHSSGISVPIAGVALGARIIEKHFILNKSLGGPDASFSLEPTEFTTMVKSIREVESSIGHVSYELTDKTRKNREFSRSLFAVKDIAAGETISDSNVRSIRPGFGLHPRHLKEILGRKACHSINKGTPITLLMIE
ncbi:MAG: pseudaminic acid synthase [Elusimicrobiota bacterium]